MEKKLGTPSFVMRRAHVHKEKGSNPPIRTVVDLQRHRNRVVRPARHQSYELAQILPLSLLSRPYCRLGGVRTQYVAPAQTTASQSTSPQTSKIRISPMLILAFNVCKPEERSIIPSYYLNTIPRKNQWTMKSTEWRMK